MSDPQTVSDRRYNNADSFAHAFDQAWQQHDARSDRASLAREEKLSVILAQVSDHPFAQADPAMARQVAEFRIRLLGL
ncbi:MAG: hypothetical protein ACK55X_04235 [Synechococcaceae cyanobacterium]|jgi:hypothetical protein